MLGMNRFQDGILEWALCKLGSSEAENDIHSAFSAKCSPVHWHSFVEACSWRKMVDRGHQTKAPLGNDEREERQRAQDERENSPLSFSAALSSCCALSYSFNLSHNRDQDKIARGKKWTRLVRWSLIDVPGWESDVSTSSKMVTSQKITNKSPIWKRDADHD